MNLEVLIDAVTLLEAATMVEQNLDKACFVGISEETIVILDRESNPIAECRTP